jgi:hypothetical protein
VTHWPSLEHIQELCSRISVDDDSKRVNCLRKTDIWILPQGTLTLVRPLTQRASEWISQHVQDDPQWFGPALVLECDYLADLLNRMIEDGLHVTQSFQNNEERASQIPKLNAQPEVRGPAPQVVNNNK